MSAETADSSARRGAFVGRDRELAELRAGLADALGGRGRVFLIVGEAGIGKTRLASEVDTAAVGAGARVCWARCWEGGGAPAFWPWTVLLRGLTSECESAALAAAFAGATAALALVPELRARVPGLPALPAGSVLDSEHARFPLFAAVVQVVRRLAAERPLLLVLDDLHAADLPSLALLAFVARDIHDARVLLVATAREVAAQHDAERARLLALIARGGDRLPLAGWSADEVARHIVGAGAGEPSAALVGTLHGMTDGNPFFVDEIVRLLIAEGHGHLPDHIALRIPGSVRAIVRERLRPLAASSLHALAAAAVAGRDFELAVVREACATEASALLDALGAAEAAGVIVRQAGAVGRFSFAHALVRETLYEDLAPSERSVWHRRVGEALERLYAADPTPHLEQLAHHFAYAAPSGEVTKAIDYDTRAARHAAELLAFEVAARHYERALEVQALQAPNDESARLELRLGLGEMQSAAWDLDAARQTFRAAADGARRLLRPDGLARAALGFAGLGFGLPRGVVDLEVVALLEEALRLLGARRDALWARVAVRLAVELHFSPEGERTDALSREAVETARRLGDDATLAHVLNARHFAVWSTATPEDRLALTDEAVRLAQRLADPDLELEGRTFRLLDLIEVGDGIGFDREFEVYDHLVEHRRLPKYLGFAAALRGVRALWLGRFEEAVARAEAALMLGERIGARTAFMSASAQIFFARRAQGRLAEVEPAARAAAELFPAIPAPRCLLALLYAELDREMDARREYERLAGDDFASLQRRNVLHPLAHSLAEVCVYLGDRARAAILYRQLLPFAGRIMGLGPSVVFGPASHPLATLAALLEEPDDAVRHFENALDEASRMQGPAWLAAIQYDYAGYLLARGETQRAGELAGAALEHARAHAMPALAARAGALQARCVAAAQEDGDSRVAMTAVGDGTHPSRAAPTERGGRILPFPANPSARPAGAPPSARRGVFRRAGADWTIGLDGPTMRLRGTSGLSYLAHLLHNPGRDIHAVDLAALEHAPEPTLSAPLEWSARVDPSRTERARLDVSRAIRSALRHIAEHDRTLAAHLEAAVAIGVACSYRPDPRAAVQWSL